MYLQFPWNDEIQMMNDFFIASKESLNEMLSSLNENIQVVVGSFSAKQGLLERLETVR